MSSLSLFWFDVATSVPLSYIDLYYAQVRQRARVLVCPCLRVCVCVCVCLRVPARVRV